MQRVHKEQFEIFNASNYKVGIVVARFNSDVTEALLESVKQRLSKYQIPPENTFVYCVAGSVEIPLILKKLAESKKFDCLIAIGAVIRGETLHFNYVAKILSEGVLRITLDFGIPIGFGVLTTNNHEQALARLHVGGEAAEAALQSAKIIKGITLT